MKLNIHLDRCVGAETIRRVSMANQIYYQI